MPVTPEERRANRRAYYARNRERVAAYRRKNKERISASWKRYYQRKKTELYQKQRVYTAANPEKVRQWRHTDYERHREDYIARARRRWREKNDECRAYEAKRYRGDKLVIHARQRNYVNRNREKIAEYQRLYRVSAKGRAGKTASDRRCSVRVAAYKAEWARRNRERLSQRLCIYFRERSRRDPAFAMRLRLRARLVATIRRLMTGRSATGVIRELLGCSEPELVRHLESKFLPGMSWDNRNQWHIDHIKPLCAFDLTDPEQQAVAFHYSNLQPLWALDNMRKGRRWQPPHSSS
jgi:hypothetical protein